MPSNYNTLKVKKKKKKKKKAPVLSDSPLDANWLPIPIPSSIDHTVGIGLRTRQLQQKIKEELVV